MSFHDYRGSVVHGSGTTVCPIGHGEGPLSGKRSVLAVLTNANQSVTSLTVSAGWPNAGSPGGWSPQGTFVGQGKKWSLFGKICTTEPRFLGYDVTFNPPIPPTGGFIFNTVAAHLADFTAGGEPVSAITSAESASGTTLTLPSLTAATPADIFAVIWDDPATALGELLPVSPLISILGSRYNGGGGLEIWTQAAHEPYTSDAPTGTRSFTVTSGTHSGALGVMVLVGGAPVGGGWAVGTVRMGSN